MTHQVATLPIKPDAQARMGSILHEQGKLREEDIERVLRTQKRDGGSFGETACRLGLVSEGDVQQALARQFGYHYLQPGDSRYPRELVAAYDPFGPQCEILRAVRTHLMHSWFPHHPALTVASAGRGEGASFFAANLAVTCAQLGKRTLLVDANLRRPSQQNIFNLGRRQGLSDILAGRAGVETFAKVDAFPQLSVLPAGTIPPNPLELLARPAFGELQESLSSRFDVILIDVPSFAVGADALTVSASIGGTLLVCRKDRARASAIRDTARQLTRSGVELVGSVLIEF